MHIGSIGDIVFEVSTSLIRNFSEYTDSVSTRIGTHEVGGSEPVLEFIGPGVRSIDIPVRLNAALGVDVEADIARAQEYARTGELLTLIIGDRPIGGAGAQWLLESVETSRSQFDRSGAAVLAEITFALRMARTANTPLPISQTIEKQNTQRIRT